MLSQNKLHEIDTRGWTRIHNCLSTDECDEIKSLYDKGELFRSRVSMQRHGFGAGEYQYFRYPLPSTVNDLRARFYKALLPLANHWRQIWKQPAFPREYEHFLTSCHNAEQTNPTPLLLKYGEGDYNRLHQDLYGDWVFPLQAAILLSAPQTDFDGGEFVLTEQKPRNQSRVSVVPLLKGDAVVFAVNQRPVKSARGHFRVNMRHGVSEIRRGERFTLGIILHDAH